MTQTPQKPRKTRKIVQRLALASVVFCAAAAATTPVLAATNVIMLDTGAATIIAMFAILLLSIIFEVLRFSSHREIPHTYRSLADLKRISHE